MSLVTLPTVDAVVASSTATAGMVFNTFLEYMIFAFAIGVGVAILVWLFRKMRGASKKVFSGGKRRSRGRRR